MTTEAIARIEDLKAWVVLLAGMVTVLIVLAIILTTMVFDLRQKVGLQRSLGVLQGSLVETGRWQVALP